MKYHLHENEAKNHHRKHILSLYALVVILLVSQVFTISMLSVRTSQLSHDLNSTFTKISNDLTSNQIENANKINQLSESIAASQESTEKQISQLKASASSDFSGIIEQSLNSVVTIVTDVGQGTGFMVSSDGYVVTNAHVLSGARYAKTILANKQSLDAELVGYNLTMDIALLKIPGVYPSLQLGDSNEIKVGEKVIAIGNPLGLSFSATEGIISAVDRQGQNNIPAYIQTDVALNPGNSGGPLINKQGDVVGINNFKIGGFESLGFALESNYVRDTVNEISLNVLNQTIV